MPAGVGHLLRSANAAFIGRPSALAWVSVIRGTVVVSLMRRGGGGDREEMMREKSGGE